MERIFHFVALSGSLRKGSFNTMALHAAQKLTPDHIHIEQLSILQIPFFNQDLYDVQFPEEVEKLNDAIQKADAVLIFTPEYLYSVPGVLKNVLDFISRSPKKPFHMKPVGILGASIGLLGTARAQYHLRQIMVNLNAMVMNKPEIMITQAHTKFDESGNITDHQTKELLQQYILSLAEFCNSIRS
jgi:chromate reductase, NAD(P)H dehydrogenase (quinone)